MSFQNCKVVTANADQAHYFAPGPASSGFCMSSSSLRVFGQCPSRWIAGYEPPNSDAKQWGSALDCSVLTPQQFSSRFALRPVDYTKDDGTTAKWNGNAGPCRAWKKVAESLGQQIITRDELTRLGEAHHALLADDVIRSFIEHSLKQVWVAGEWLDDETGLVIPCKCLIDLVPGLESEFPKSLGDLKTTRNAGVKAWSRWCYSAGYHIQAAWNLDMYCAATGEDRNTFCFIVQESFSPWQTAKRMLSQDYLTFARAEINRLMALYAGCLKHDQWPTYDDTDEACQGWTLVQPEPWMQTEQMFAPQFETDEPQPEPEPEMEDHRV